MANKIKSLNLRATLQDSSKKLFLICWYRCANYGTTVIEADSKEQALDHFAYTKNQAVTVIATEISKDNLPLIKLGNEQKDFNKSLIAGD